MVILGVWTSLFFCCLFLGCLDKCSVGIFFTCIYSSGVYTYIHIYIHTHTHTHIYGIWYNITYFLKIDRYILNLCIPFLHMQRILRTYSYPFCLSPTCVYSKMDIFFNELL
jgi:hypothetical protein